MTKLVQAYVPDALRSAAESAVAPFLASPGDVWTVPLTSDGENVTHYGLNAPMDDSGQLFANLAALSTVLLGGGYQVTDPDDYSCDIHWHGWLQTRGLTVYQEMRPE